MNLVAQLRRVIGLGAPALELRDVSASVRPGDELRATIQLAAGSRPVRLEHLELRLDEERLTYTTQATHEFDFWQKVGGFSVPVAGRVLAAGEVLRLPVTLGLPPALEPSAAHRRYRLSARLGPLGLGPGDAVIVSVVA